LWVVTTALLIGFVTATASFKIPPPLQEKQVCEQAAAKRKANPSECERGETVLNRSLRDPVAFYTFWLTLFTGGLTLIGVWQWDAIRRQLNQADREFHASHRPRMRVRNINVSSVGTVESWMYNRRLARAYAGDAFSGQFFIANVGEGDGRIREACIMFIANKSTLPMRRPYEGDDGNLFGSKAWMRSGESNPMPFTETGIFANKAPGDVVDFDLMPLFALGWIEYEDRSGSVRRTAFCRRYDPTLGRFDHFAEAGPDYEHED
jgi:hypothetical protein